MKNETTIKCPECGNQIDVNDILKHQIEDTMRLEFQEKLKEQSVAFKEKDRKLAAEKAAFEATKKRENDLFQERLEKETRTREKEIKAKLASKFEEENKDKYEELQKELSEKSNKLKELHKKDAEISRLQREKEEMSEAIKAESARELNELLAQEKVKIKRQAAESEELKNKELQKQLDDQKKMVKDLQKKQEQGSMQLQGEVQELAIEEWLQSKFPLDTIEEIKKGANGADCLQIVNTYEMQNCGILYYESKRTKTFQPSWIEKFKNDIRAKNATLGVLVTEVLPAGMDRMGMVEGIWVCTFEEFKGLSAVLRESVVQLGKALATKENKGDKMSMLYDFLTSNEFRLQIEGIVEGFTQMQTDLNNERNTMKRIWKQREKQIEKVIGNTTGMYGSIKGIAGNSIGNIALLEMDGAILTE